MDVHWNAASEHSGRKADAIRSADCRRVGLLRSVFTMRERFFRERSRNARPCPWVSIKPAGGVEGTKASLRAWFQAGVACVGIGSNLIGSDLVKAGDCEGITPEGSSNFGASPSHARRSVKPTF